MKNNILKNITLAVILILALAFVAKFGGSAALRLYIETGIGDCRKIPIFCMAPQEEIPATPVSQEYLNQLIPYQFPKVTLSAPRGFSVVQEMIKKPYYKKQKHLDKRNVIYILGEPAGFFPNLYPALKKKGISDNYEFIRRVMHAKVKEIEGLTDAFFVIMKGIFIPDLGDQTKAHLARFTLADRKGFINYNLASTGNYFDCNIIDREGDFFKIYIKDKSAGLDLEKVLTIISTARETRANSLKGPADAVPQTKLPQHLAAEAR